MKKLITIILSLAMILPAAAIADTEQELLGTWVGTRDVFQGRCHIFLCPPLCRSRSHLRNTKF